jgi:hypothetical protein
MKMNRSYEITVIVFIYLIIENNNANFIMEKEYKNKWVKFRDNCIGELRIRNQE